jgi:hypothetical protein
MYLKVFLSKRKVLSYGLRENVKFLTSGGNTKDMCALFYIEGLLDNFAWFTLPLLRSDKVLVKIYWNRKKEEGNT